MSAKEHMTKEWFKRDYRMKPMTYRDVPGFMNEAESIYSDIIMGIKDKKNKENHIVVELGTFLGQSACRMASLIKDNKIQNIRFDTIDLFWLPLHIMNSRDDWDEKSLSGIPPSFHQYVDWLQEIVKKETGFPLSPIDVSMHPIRQLELEGFVNFITCDSQYASRLYDDNTIDFLWCDANHHYEYVSTELRTFWPKIKKEGILAGDDYNEKEVQKAVKEFCMGLKDNEYKLETTSISFKIKKI